MIETTEFIPTNIVNETNTKYKVEEENDKKIVLRGFLHRSYDEALEEIAKFTEADVLNYIKNNEHYLLPVEKTPNIVKGLGTNCVVFTVELEKN